MRDLGARYETVWNSLLVDQARLSLARDARAREYGHAAERVARLEPEVFGTRIAREALAASRRWRDAEKRLRIAAAEAESLAVALRATDLAAAEARYHEALAAYRSLRERRRAAWVLGGLGVLHFLAGDDARADSFHVLALAARQELGDPQMVGNSLTDIGTTAHRRGDHARARAYLEAARRAREATGQRAHLGTTLGWIGLLLRDSGQPDSAEVFFRDGILHTSAAGDSVRTRTLAINFGVLQMERLRYGESEALLNRARAAVEADDVEAADAEHNLGELLARTGRFAGAIERLESVAGKWREHGAESKLGTTLMTLGGCWARLGDLRRGRAALDEALEIAGRLGDSALRARALNNLSLAQQNAGDRQGAMDRGAEAFASARASGDSLVMREVMRGLGELAIEQGDPREAERWFESVLACAPDRVPVSAWLEDRLNRCVSWILLGKLEEADRELGALRRLLEREGAVALESYACVNLAEIAFRRGDPLGAVAWSRRGVRLVDSLRAEQGVDDEAVRFMAGRADEFESMIHLLGIADAAFPDSGFGDEAFYWSERAHSRTLIDRIHARDLRQGRARTFGIDDVARRLKPGQALLEFSVGDSSSSLWVLRPDGWSRHGLPPRRMLSPRVRSFRESLVHPRQAQDARTIDQAERLYDLLLAQAGPWLAGASELLIVPDDALALIPFESLRAPATRSGSRREWLAERYRIRYLPAASFLAREPRTDACDPVVVAVAHPFYGSDSAAAVTTRSAAPDARRLPPLPGTLRELEALRRHAGARRVVELAGARATRDELLRLPELPGAEVLHFGTHGWSNEAEPERSALWLAADSSSGEPSALRLNDILGLRLGARHVTLAACESGFGRLERGEGVVGLARGFLAAGAGSVLVSLWPVEDRTTALLMERFYQHLLAEGMDRAAALAEARRDLMRRSVAPAFWAPFVLIGDSDPLAR